jgi:[acyl-carrier-protein] S-malonyltransferase
MEFSVVAGHSVGEYAALYAAEVISFEDAIKLVALRGQLMFTAGEDEPGTMMAVMGADDEKVEAACAELTENGNGNVVVAANYNCPGQLVVSGSAEYLRANAAAFKAAGAKIVKELPVSGAFHSPLMKPAKEKLAEAINNIDFKDAKVPVYSNVYAKPISNASEIKEALIAQLTAPVKWTQSLQAMDADGITDFVELGPGNVLQGLVKRTLAGKNIGGIDKVEDVEKYIAG